MKKRVFVSGSLAYDVLMDFKGNFSDHIFPHSIDNLSVSFLARNRERYFGGCGGNIAYGLSRFEMIPYLVSIAGADFSEYMDYLVGHGVDTGGVIIDTNYPTAAAYILSDESASQIAMFSPGAMEACEADLLLDDSFDFALLSPLMPSRMVEVAQSLRRMDRRYLLDPGQALVSLTPEQLELLVDGAMGLILNEYELNMFEQKLGRSLSDLMDKFEFAVVTLGENGSELRMGGEVVRVPAVRDLQVMDPTGCGDAFRGGFVAALLEGKAHEEALKYGNVAASFCLEVKGSQSYDFTSGEFLSRYSKNYC